MRSGSVARCLVKSEATLDRIPENWIGVQYSRMKIGYLSKNLEMISSLRAEMSDIIIYIIICNLGTAMATLKLTAVGTSTGVVIPKEMLNRMKVARGDALHVVETPDGYLITPYDPAIAAQVDAGREFMKAYRDTFKALAE
jgi:putative addiction module antidote